MLNRPPVKWTAPALALLAIAACQAPEREEGPHVIWRSPHEAEICRVRGEQVERHIVEVGDQLMLNAPFLIDPDLPVSATPPAVEPFVYEDVSRIFAVGDIHGQFDVVVNLLRTWEVIDGQLHWSFGDGHLVFDGDVFDRGDRVTETLWLIHRLEGEAMAAGGRVHLILGNHEAMPLLNDLRYVNPRYLEVIGPALGRTYPELYGPDTELGRWLRTKHAVIRINDLLFVHGGLSPTILERGFDLAFINETIRANLDTPYEDIKADETLEFLFRYEGPLWYRGYFIDWSDYQRTTPELTRALLDRFNANHVVVGHTGATRVHSVFRGMVINVHVWMAPGKPTEALLWEDGGFFRLTSDGAREALDLTSETWHDAE